MCHRNQVTAICEACTKSLYISCAADNFYGTDIEIWAGFGPVGSTEKKIGTYYEQFLKAVFLIFSWTKNI